MIMENEIMVSINIVTYNHEKYIAKAIKGALMQKCNFNIELIIANDCSFDETDRVILDIIKNHPRGFCIRYTNHKKNIGMQPNGIFAIKQSKGKYIALCDGDDYWTDPLKLQKQVDFLEKNNDVSITCHNVQRLNYLTKQLKHIEYFKHDQFLDEKDVINYGGKITPLLSYVFKSEYLHNVPKWVFNSPIGDLSMILYLMTKGKVYYFKDLMGVYRENLPNSWTIKTNENGLWIKFKYKIKLTAFIQNYNRFTDFKYSEYLGDVYNSKNTVKHLTIALFAYLYEFKKNIIG